MLSSYTFKKLGCDELIAALILLEGNDLTMYAISFDLCVNSLHEHYTGNNYNNAYMEIKRYLSARGFESKQGSIYFGDETITAVNAIMCVSNMSKKFPWLKECVSDIRLFRISENDDLTPAL